MALRVIWSPRADKDFDRINDYLIETWSEKVLMKFVKDTFAKIEHIARFPKYILKPKNYQKFVNAR